MNKHEHAFHAALGLALGATLTAFFAHAQNSPGYVYDAGASVVRDGVARQCVQTSAWRRENATKECHPELFPEPRAAAPAPKHALLAAPIPAPVAAPAPLAAPAVVVLAAVVAAPKSKVMVFGEAALFSFGKAELTPEGQQKLREYREEARAELSAATAVAITGHTDSTGAAEFNQQLSLRRAEAVRDYLVQLGGDGKIMQVSGMGETQPLSDNKTAAGRAQNRRVEVEVLGTAK